MTDQTIIEQARRICAQARPEYADGFLRGEYDESSTEMRAVLIALGQGSAVLPTQDTGAIKASVQDDDAEWLRHFVHAYEADISPIGRDKLLEIASRLARPTDAELADILAYARDLESGGPVGVGNWARNTLIPFLEHLSPTPETDQQGGASLRDRAGRPADGAPAGLRDTATIPSARGLPSIGRRMNMQAYIGSKVITAEPQDKDGTPGYKVVYPDNYISWSHPRPCSRRHTAPSATVSAT